jgi:hypothetical protein
VKTYSPLSKQAHGMQKLSIHGLHISHVILRSLFTCTSPPALLPHPLTPTSHHRSLFFPVPLPVSSSHPSGPSLHAVKTHLSRRPQKPRPPDPRSDHPHPSPPSLPRHKNLLHECQAQPSATTCPTRQTRCLTHAPPLPPRDLSRKSP